MRRNAILAAPQALTDRIMKWVTREVATYYRDQGGDLPPAVEAAVEADDPKTEVIKRPRSHSFVVDLSDLPAHYPTDRMTGQMPSVKVVLEAPRALRPMGGGLLTFASWHPEPRTLRKVTLNLLPPGRGETESVGGYEAYKRRLRSSLEHELRHMVQTLFSDALEKKKSKEGLTWMEKRRKAAKKEKEKWLPKKDRTKKKPPKEYGIPPRDPATDKLYAEIADLEHLRDEVYSPVSPKWTEAVNQLEVLRSTTYFLEPVEFFPHVGNQQDDLLEDCGRTANLDVTMGSSTTTHALARTIITNECLRRFIQRGSGGDHFLGTLKKHAPQLYKRAVSEIVAWVPRHNEKAQRLLDSDAGKEPKPISTHRIMAEVQDDLDREDLVLATYLRQHRPEFLLYADREAQKL